eukprot:2176212-Pyramimonas_sp.AAC.1
MEINRQLRHPLLGVGRRIKAFGPFVIVLGLRCFQQLLENLIPPSPARFRLPVLPLPLSRHK